MNIEWVQRIERKIQGIEDTLIKYNIVDLCEENQGKMMNKKIPLDEMECANCVSAEQYPMSRKFTCDNPFCDFYGRTTSGQRKDKKCEYFVKRAK